MTPSTQRIAVGLEYDGTDFVGWQAQRTGRTIQGAVEAAVSEVADQRIGVTGAGRTDAGVHADLQVAHFDTDARRTPRQWLLGINSNLPQDVVVNWVQPVENGFNARRSATARRYRYRILERATRSALLRHRSWWRRETLDCAAMTSAATGLLGERDFSAYRAAGCQSRTPVRRLTSVRVYRADELLYLEFVANAFLQHMVSQPGRRACRHRLVARRRHGGPRTCWRGVIAPRPVSPPLLRGSPWPASRTHRDSIYLSRTRGRLATHCRNVMQRGVHRRRPGGSDARQGISSICSSCCSRTVARA